MTRAVLLRGGVVHDGTGAPGRVADVLIEGGVVRAVGPEASADAAPAIDGPEAVDVTGLAILPGFIDVHSHDDAALLRPGGLDPKTGQGVSAVVIGNCGLGVAPSSPGLEASAAPVLGPFPRSSDPREQSAGSMRSWESFADYLATLGALPRPVHTAALVPHAPLRIAAMGFERRPATPAEVDTIAGAAADALDSGAVGISLGLMYAPGDTADRAELTALGRAVADRDRLLVAHIRNEADHLRASIDELAAVARDTGARLHISHLKVTGPRNRGRMPRILDHLEFLRAEGVDVTVDVYPYDAGSTTALSLFPPDDQGDLLTTLADPAARRSQLARLEVPWEGPVENQWAAIGPQRILLAGFPEGDTVLAGYEGRSVASIAAERGQVPLETLADLVLATDAQLTVVVFHTDGDGMRQALAWPHALVGSDGLPRESGFVHPRLFGTFPRALTLGVLPFDEALRRMTSAAADRFGLPGRGRIEAGAAADLQLVDLAEYADRATYASPRCGPAGLRGLMVGGVLASEGAAGRLLRA